MRNISNENLAQEVSRRLLLNEKTINAQQEMLQQLQDVNKKLEQAEMLKSHFISNIKNEINNPLASILALSKNLLRKNENLTPEAKKVIHLIYNEAHSLDFQLDNIMTAAEIEAGHITPQLVSVNVSQILEHVVQSFAHSIEKKSVQIEMVGRDQVQFVTDPHYFKVIVANLISNAIKFCKEHSTVVVVVSPSAKLLTLSVANTGCAIQKEDLKKIFDRFKQLDAGMIKKYQGHGLGLSITKDLVEFLDGEITVNTCEEGSTFSVSLPIRPGDGGVSAVFDDGSELLFDQSF